MTAFATRDAYRGHMTPAETAWLAGLFEGEGCLHRRKDGCGYELVINMVDRDVVERAHAVAGVGTLAHIRRSHIPNNRDQTRWRVGRRDDIRVLAGELLPWLGERRRRAVEEFIAWYDAGAPTRRTDEQRAHRAAYMRDWRAASRLTVNV